MSLERSENRTVLSIDAMGGDLGPAAVVAGISHSAKVNPDLHFILHGPEAELRRLVNRRRALLERVEIRDAPDVVTMDDKPSQVLRTGRNTSMWSALEAVRACEAEVCVRCCALDAIHPCGPRLRLCAHVRPRFACRAATRAR